MPVIRKVEIANFRSIKKLVWYPGVGINCLVGSGDSGKSTILDAIDLCLGARRSANITDADFFGLDVEKPISITLLLGALGDSLRNYEAYGDYLRGYNAETESLEEEPGHGLETTLCLNLQIEGDLELRWKLISKRADDKGVERNLNWSDRVNLAPTRLGAMSDYNLAWKRGSVLMRLSEEKPDASKALSTAAREARKTFGDEAEKQLGDALAVVNKAAGELGIRIGANAKALLDTHSVSVSGGSIALHNDQGVPLRGLGLGSTRLLIAGLQRAVAAKSSILLVDEVENGLEPHRIIRLLGSLGAKTTPPPQQVFATTHSPIVLRELDHSQLRVLRWHGDQHYPLSLPQSAQGTLRAFPEAFLAPSVLVCEGATEIGLMRGFEQYLVSQNRQSIFAAGTALVDCGGGHPDRAYDRALEFAKLGYRTAVFRDDDLHPTPAKQAKLGAQNGSTFTWRADQSIEMALIGGASELVLYQMIDYAILEHGLALITAHIQTASQNAENLDGLRALLNSPEHSINPGQRTVIAAAAGMGWFKTVRYMEHVARNILAPNFAALTPELQHQINEPLIWAQQKHG
ncbi:Predicted ATP-dependent endonuclease of the OLD family, contains P-loop ATPase and TOPRIM domains [Loktanella sp. DSM 29012]|uniref:ATP-dependent nuclease n=1 Tax=Loktanella sp. DSM 29012 TaxID=1881056 RepID=UPI0008D58730|nr:ATP-binding protein [Loktanella sp. DSM 29012]SEQ88127.1 Predicted ATP-dependent endonuclease of the OLD family, contains P-loop ATPase and TOPRIM domains [Loktanella sp. DSM 29012]